jgi:hypothetical protein
MAGAQSAWANLFGPADGGGAAEEQKQEQRAGTEARKGGRDRGGRGREGGPTAVGGGAEVSNRDQDEDPGRDAKNRSGRRDRGDRKGSNAALVLASPGGGGSAAGSRGDRAQGSLRGSDRGEYVEQEGSGHGALRGAPVAQGGNRGRQDSAAGGRSQGRGVETISEAERRKRSDYNRTLDQSRQQILNDMGQSQQNMSQGGSGGAGAIQIGGTQVNLDDLDMKKLTHEQNKDAREIARLEQQVQNLTRSRRSGDLTMGAGSDVDKYVSMGRQGSVRSKSAREIGDLEYELERY